jgi:Domain of unknown function (DUF4314)
MLTPNELATIRATYKRGRRVRFLGFGERDPRRLQPGTEGTIQHVDGLGTVHVEWDTGVRLGCVVRPPAGRHPDRLELL